MASKSSEAISHSKIHIMMFPFLAFGHISPHVQLAQKLVNTSSCDVKITFVTANGNVPRVTSLLPSSPSTSVVPIYLPHVSGLPTGAESTADLTLDGAEIIKIALDLCKPQVEEILRRVSPDVVLFDFSQPWLPSIAIPLGIKTIYFSVFSASSTSYLRANEHRFAGTYPTIDELQQIPAKSPHQFPFKSLPKYMASDFMYPFMSFHGQPSVSERVNTCINDCDAIMMKTCMEMEGPYIESYTSLCRKKIILAGPIVPEPPKEDLDPHWSNWLDAFPKRSVIFSSFGSETFLSEHAAIELLLGLEMSGFPFIIVLNFPKGVDAKEMLKKSTPPGFEQRVKGRGVVHCGWVPQQLILRHESVGCFLCHAGFSSVIEGLVSDCQLVMLPQKGDQFMNSILFAYDLGVGVEVERREDGGFGKEGVKKAITMVMYENCVDDERIKMRENHKKWRDFLINKKIQETFNEEFVEQLKNIIVK